jgi:hypothetical protein
MKDEIDFTAKRFDGDYMRGVKRRAGSGSSLRGFREKEGGRASAIHTRSSFARAGYGCAVWSFEGRGAVPTLGHAIRGHRCFNGAKSCAFTGTSRRGAATCIVGEFRTRVLTERSASSGAIPKPFATRRDSLALSSGGSDPSAKSVWNRTRRFGAPLSPK